MNVNPRVSQTEAKMTLLPLLPTHASCLNFLCIVFIREERHLVPDRQGDNPQLMLLLLMG